MRKHAVILFTRVPVAGRVKTRLMPQLNGAECAALQRAMSLDAADMLDGLDRDLFVFHSDDGPVSLLAGLPERASVHPQRGADLGERMHNALCQVLDLGYQDVLLLGSDLPFLTAGEVAVAGDLLNEAEVLLCPSPDGGYWLVGLSAPFAPLFTHQRYGTGSVLEDALSVCARHGRRTVLGPVRRDLDTPEDLNFFQRELLAGRILATERTANFLKKVGQKLETMKSGLLIREYF